MNIEIQPLRIEDYQEVTELWRNCEGINMREDDNRRNLERYLQRNPSLSFVARYNQKIIAAILCGHDGRRGYLYHLAVAPEYRRNGIASSLVEKSQISLHALGIRKCHIFVMKENELAQKFWEFLSWRQRQDLHMMSFNIMGNADAF
jgi:ribosomal protein S18 acetylase RimI-like enzyme